MTTLYAQPYDITATGFYFETAEQYAALAAKAVNDYGQPVEEFEIQFIDGEAIDAALARAIRLNQANFAAFLESVDSWEDWEKDCVIIAVGECGQDFDPECGPHLLGVEIFDCHSLRELAERFVDDGLFGEIPESLKFYIDYDAIARDLAVDYTATEIAGAPVIYRCA